MVQLVDQHPGSNFILLMFGKISERSKILNNITARIANRTDEDSRPELAAILTAVENFRPAAGRTVELGFNSCQRLRIGTVCHQKIEALAEHFFAVVIDFFAISDMPRVDQPALQVCVVQRAWRGLLPESRPW